MGKYLKLFETHADYAAYIGGSEKILPNVSYCENENEVHYNPWSEPIETRVVATFNVTSTSSATTICNSSATSYFSEIEIDGVVQPSVVTSYTFDTTGEHIVKYTFSDPTTIGSGAFSGCSGLTSITIPNSVTTISSGAFYGCSGLTSITIPNSVTTISNHAFGNCTNLTSVILNCSSLFNNMSDYFALKFGEQVTEYIIGDGVTTIPNQAFGSSTSLTSIVIPNSVTSIGHNAFIYCTSLTHVTIGNSVTTIGNYAFSGCSGLTNITSLATTAPTIQNSVFQDIKTGGTLTVPSGSTGYDVWMGTGDYYLGKYNWTKVEQ